MTTLSKLFAGLAVAGVTALASSVSGAYVITAAPLTPEFTNTASVGGYWTAIEYRTQTAGSGGLLGAFDSWCVEVAVQDSPGPWTYNVTDVVGGTHWTPAVQQAVERLWWFADNATGAPTYSTETTPLGSNATLYTAAFQIALWELVQENSTAYNLLAGGIDLDFNGPMNAFTTQVYGIANSWLATITSANYNGGQTRLEYLDTALDKNNEGQDRIRPYIPNNGGDDPAKIPAPAIAWLLALGAAALAVKKHAK